MGLLQIITSDLEKNRTVDLLKYLREKLENDFMVSIQNVRCDVCNEELIVDTPMEFESSDLKEIHDVMATLIQRQEKIDRV